MINRKSKVDPNYFNYFEIMLNDLKHEKNLLFNFYQLSNSQKIDPIYTFKKK